MPGRDPVLRFALATFLILAVVFASAFSYYYVKYERIIAHRFEGSVFANSAKIYARPVSIAVGEKADLKEIAAELRHAGYAEKSGQSTMGSYHLTAGSIQIEPGPNSYHSPEPATIRVRQAQADRNAHRNGIGATLQQAANIRILWQLGRSWAARFVRDQWVRRSLAGLFQQGHQRHYFARGRLAGWHYSAAKLSFAIPASRSRAGAQESCAGQHGRNPRDHARAGRQGQGGAAEARAAQRRGQPSTVFCRSGTRNADSQAS